MLLHWEMCRGTLLLSGPTKSMPCLFLSPGVRAPSYLPLEPDGVSTTIHEALQKCSQRELVFSKLSISRFGHCNATISTLSCGPWHGLAWAGRTLLAVAWEVAEHRDHPHRLWIGLFWKQSLQWHGCGQFSKSEL